MSDEAAKRTLWISIVLGAGLGFLWGISRWSPLDIMTWNLMGLGVVTTVSLAALVIAVAAAARERKRARAESARAGPARISESSTT